MALAERSSLARSTTADDRLAIAGRWFLAAGMFGAALAVGTVHTTVLCVVTVVLGASAVLSWWNAERMTVRAPAMVLLVTGAALVAYTALQCVPIPIALLARIAPHNADLWSEALRPLHEGAPLWAPISLDPTATRVEIVKGVSYLLAFVAALQVAARRKGVLFLLRTVVVTALALAVAALLHPAFGAVTLFGVYAPSHWTTARHLAPLLNPNHLAGYLNLGLCCLLAMVAVAESTMARALPAAGALMLVATQVWVASRAGTACMILGAVLVVALFRRHARGNRKGVDVTVVVTMAAAVAGASLVVLTSVDEAAGELLTTETSKLHVIGNSFAMLRDFGIWGVGRGSFEEVFPRFRESMGHVSISHPENFVAQWTTEWGVPVAVLALGAIAFALRPRVALVRARVVSGAWAALVALAAQNLVDFSSEIPGVMVTAVTCAAVVVAGTSGLKPSGRLQRWAQSSRRVAMASACASLLSLALGLSCLGRGLDDDRDALYQALWRRTSLVRMHTLARAAMRRHPAEPYLPFAVGLRAVDRKDENPVPWLGATLERARVYGAAHLMLAKLLAPRSPSQARLEYRLAIEQAPTFTDAVAPEIPSLVSSYDDALEVVPSGKGGAKLLERLIGDLRERLPATCVRLDRELSDRSPEAEGPANRAAEEAVADLEAGDAAPWCLAAGRPLCVDRALAQSRELQKTAPHACRGYIMEARARLAADDRGSAVAALERAANEATDRKACLHSVVEVAMSVQDGARVESSLHQILRAGCASDQECLEDYLYVAAIEERAGNMASALIAYKQAYEHAPENDQVLEQLADAAARSGVHGEAADHYQKLAERHPEDKRWRMAADKEHDAFLGDFVKR